MAYIGNQNYQAYVTLNNQTFTTSGSTTIYALNYTVTNANNLDLYIGGSKQQPGVAYTASGNTLTLTTATSSSMYAVYLGQGIQTTNIPVGVVTTSNLVSGFNLPATQGGTGVTTYSTGSLLYASNSTTLTTLAPGTSGYALTLNGITPTWASVGGSNTPAFNARMSADQTISNNVNTKVNFDTVDFDTNSAFNTSTYRFTVPSGQNGKYFIYSSIKGYSNAASALQAVYISIYKNGSQISYSGSDPRNSDGYYFSAYTYVTLSLVATDYIEIYGYIIVTSGSNTIVNQGFSYNNVFGGFKLIGA